MNVKSQVAKTEEQFKQKLFEKFDNVLGAFRKFDSDNDCNVSKSEFKRFLDDVNLPLDDQVFDRVVSDIDKDGSGEVDYQEFMRYFGACISAEDGEGGVSWERAEHQIELKAEEEKVHESLRLEEEERLKKIREGEAMSLKSREKRDILHVDDNEIVNEIEEDNDDWDGEIKFSSSSKKRNEDKITPMSRPSSAMSSRSGGGGALAGGATSRPASASFSRSRPASAISRGSSTAQESRSRSRPASATVRSSNGGGVLQPVNGVSGGIDRRRSRPHSAVSRKSADSSGNGDSKRQVIQEVGKKQSNRWTDHLEA